VIADDGTVYMTSLYEHLYALSPLGDKKWEYTITADTPLNVGGGLGSMPAVAPDGTLYVIHNFALHALAPDGSVVWHQPDVKAQSAPVIAADGTVFVTTTDGKIAGVSDEGDVVVSIDVPVQGVQSLYAAPVFGANGWLYVAGWGGALFAYGP
jgi:outer membrane protein assembly factor BamB